MDNMCEGNAETTALIVLSAVSALACASLIGAVVTLAVISMEKSAPAVWLKQDAAAASGAEVLGMIFRPGWAPQEGDCAVVIWKTGMIYCVHDKSARSSGEKRFDPAVVVQAQAGD